MFLQVRWPNQGFELHLSTVDIYWISPAEIIRPIKRLKIDTMAMLTLICSQELLSMPIHLMMSRHHILCSDISWCHHFPHFSNYTIFSTCTSLNVTCSHSQKATNTLKQGEYSTINNSLGQMDSTLTLAAFNIVLIFSAYTGPNFLNKTVSVCKRFDA